MAAAALTTWTHLYSLVAFLISEALSLTHHEALSLNVISHATSLLLWVTSVLLRVVLCLLQAAAGPADGRGVVCPLVGYRVVGACLSIDVCVLLAYAMTPSIPRLLHSDPPSYDPAPRLFGGPLGSSLPSSPSSSVADALHFGVCSCLCPPLHRQILLYEVVPLGWIVGAPRPPLSATNGVVGELGRSLGFGSLVELG